MYAVCVYVCMRLGTKVHLCPCVHATMHPAFTNFITRRLALPLPPPTSRARTHASMGMQVQRQTMPGMEQFYTCISVRFFVFLS